MHMYVLHLKKEFIGKQMNLITKNSLNKKRERGLSRKVEYISTAIVSTEEDLIRRKFWYLRNLSIVTFLIRILVLDRSNNINLKKDPREFLLCETSKVKLCERGSFVAFGIAP